MPKDDEQSLAQAPGLRASETNLSAIDSISGTESMAVLQRVFAFALRNPERVVLFGASARLAGAAILGARAAGRPEPCQVYAVDTAPQLLQQLWRELVSVDLDESCLLYCGDMLQFFRDVPVVPTMLCAADFPVNPHTIQAALPPGASVLVVNGGSKISQSDINGCLAHGLLVSLDSMESTRLFRTTNRCIGASAPIAREVFRNTRSLLHKRYFGQNGQEEVSVSVATSEFRRASIHDIGSGAGGYGQWPYSNGNAMKLPNTLPSGAPWPRISIVTPSFNQGCYIEQTILSVLNQEYPNVEHIVMDGGSSDETPYILKRYRDRLAHVVSERDRGQSHAINKGMKIATGDILTWLNSDDMLAPGALAAVALAFDTSGADLVAGICQLYSKGSLIGQHLTACADGPLPLNEILDLDGGWNAGQFFYQPEVMFKRSLWLQAGGHVDENAYFSMDYELWVRFAELGARLHVIGRPVACYRIHEDQKTFTAEKFEAELSGVRNAYLARTKTAWTAPNLSPVPARRQLRVVFLNDHGFQYGAGIAHERVAATMVWAGHEVIPLSLAKRSEDKEALQGYTNQALLEDIASHQPDIIIVGNLHSVRPDPGFLMLLAERFPTLCVLHDFWLFTGRCAYPGECPKYLSGCDETCPTPHEYPQLEPEAIAPAWETKRALLASGLPMLLAYSPWAAEYARKTLSVMLPEAKTPRLAEFQLSFPLETFRPLDKRTCRRLLGLPEDRFILLLTCEFADRRKGAHKLLEALHELKLPDTLVVSTSQSDPDPKLVRGLSIQRLGYVADAKQLASIYSAADLMVGPSLEETLGQIFVEAAACGTPAVGFPVAGVNAAIRDGVTGRLAAGTDVSSLAATILEMYRNRTLRHDLSVWGRLYVENEWSPFSGYHKFFLALDRLGLRQRLNMAKKVAFIPGPIVIPECRSLTESAEIRAQGLCDGEGPVAEFDLPRFNWALGPLTSFEFQAQQGGRHLIALYYRSIHPDQSVAIEVNGSQVGTFRLDLTGMHKGRMLSYSVELQPGRNTMDLRFSAWAPPRENYRPLALIITKIVWIPDLRAEATITTCGLEPNHPLNARFQIQC